MSAVRAGAPVLGDVSVIIPARNAASTIAATLRSLRSEAGLLDEILVVDDDSTDGTADSAMDEARHLGLPLRVIPARCRDAGAARNIGLDAARGRSVYFIDADDLHVAGGLTALHTLLTADPGAGIAIGAYIRDVDGRKQQLKAPSAYGVDGGHNAARYVEDRLRSIAVGSALFRRSAIGAIRFPVNLPYDEDTIFIARVLAASPVARTGQTIFVYNVVSRRSDERFIAAPRRSFLAWSRALMGLAPETVPRRSVKKRQGLVALKIARVHYAIRERSLARRFLAIARAAPLSPRDRYRALRYRVKIGALAGDRTGEAGARPHRRPAPAARREGAIVISVDPAWPPVSGADLRNWQNAGAAAECGRAWIASLGAARSRDTEMAGIRLFALSDAGPREIYGSGRQTPIDVVVPDRAVERLRKLVAALRPATAIVETLSLHPLLPVLRPLVPRLILDFHNVESDLVSQTDGPMARLFGIDPKSAGQIQAIERQAAGIVDEVWTCSSVDSDRLRAVAGDRVHIRIVPNGIPHIDQAPRSLSPAAPSGAGPRLLFVGHLAYPPNVLAAETLTKAILPELRRGLPDARLTIAGRNPAAPVRRLHGDGVVILADPPDIAALLAEADFAVLPLEAGGGTRIKAIEAMAWGVPVIATPRAVEGLDLVDGRTVRLATAPAEFCRAIRELWADAGAYQGQRAAARDHAFAHFGPAAVAGPVAAALKGGGTPSRHSAG